MKFISFLLFTILTLIGCNKEILSTKVNSQPSEKGKQQESINTALQNGSYKLFDYTNRNEGNDKNVIISPLSIQFALGMASNGAKNASLEELMSVNNLKGSNLAELNDQLTYLFHQLITAKNGIKVSISDAVFYDRNKVNVKQDYLDAVRKYYGAEVSELNFKEEQKSLNIINGWIKDNTNGKIEKALDEISADEFMFLLNAIYMKADWKNPFVIDATRAGDFTTQSGKKVRVSFMNQRVDALYSNTEQAMVVSLPLANDQLSVAFIMPKKTDINEFISREFNASYFKSLLTTARNSDLMIELPKLEIKQHFDLKAILQSMDVKSPFTGGADFSAIAGAPGDVYLTKALHDVYMKMDEKGVEGAAVTTIGVGLTSMPPPAIFNQSYIFIIYDQATGVNLFMGKVSDPSAVD
ncbi:MAG TPA: serpin family protein [Saprospiraceae bacterium]|nr:serpin family protein [Saprospiraceae bacterium]